MTFCCCFLAVSNTNGQDWESASPVFCSKPPHVSRGRLMFHRENAINESCVLIFIFIFLQQNVKEPRKTRTTLSLRKNCSPTSISSCIPLLVGAFKQKQKQTLACSNHKRDDWSWKTIMQKWSEPFLSSPTQNTWCHKCLWQFLILLHKMKKWGGIPNVHRSPILTAQCSWWKCKQLGLRGGGKKLQSFQLKRWSFLFDGAKAELGPSRGLQAVTH